MCFSDFNLMVRVSKKTNIKQALTFLFRICNKHLSNLPLVTFILKQSNSLV